MSCNCPKCNSPVNPGNECPPQFSTVSPTSTVYTFAEIVINDNLIIPEPKPDIELITNVSKNFEISDVEVLDVNLGNHLGRKVIIAGTLFLGIEYSAAVPSQELHFAHFCVPFKVMIKQRPCTTTNRGLLPADFDINDYNIRICVEHEQYHVVSPRELSKVLVVLFWLEPKA